MFDEKKILIVDDDKDFCKLLVLGLRKEGYSLRTANNGHDAIEIVRLWQPDLIVLDIMMPTISGYDVAKKLQTNAATAEIPIIMLTAKASFDDEMEGLESGAIDYITKPVDMKRLRYRIQSQLRHNSRIRQENVYRTEQIIPLPVVSGYRKSGIFRWTYRVTKRMFDFTIALLAMPFALPILAIIALAVRLDSPGPIFFVQQRTGRNGNRFGMFKFRTMDKDAEALKQKYMHLNELTWPDFKITDDPRVTKVGRFLRRSSLDELPQLLNVLKGDMSIVGPRPTSFDSSTYDLWHTERLETVPGLTGLWQVVGRAGIDFDDRVELDIQYIERQCWALDLHIMYRTFAAVIEGKGAH
jgi:lipopolysaccharide/colanic/teichoic acid biosynthesis glycosyltransferase/CheY-like chemotaxis protein